MGFPILLRWHLYIESGPSALTMELLPSCTNLSTYSLYQMTPSHGNVSISALLWKHPLVTSWLVVHSKQQKASKFRISDPSCGESTFDQWFPHEKGRYFFPFRLNNLLSKQWRYRQFETPWCPCDITILRITQISRCDISNKTDAFLHCIHFFCQNHEFVMQLRLWWH